MLQEYLGPLIGIAPLPCYEVEIFFQTNLELQYENIQMHHAHLLLSIKGPMMYCVMHYKILLYFIP